MGSDNNKPREKRVNYMIIDDLDEIVDRSKKDSFDWNKSALFFNKELERVVLGDRVKKIKKMKNYSDIEKMVLRLADSQINLPKNLILTVELNQEDFINLQDEMSASLLTSPQQWSATEFTIMTQFGVRILVRKVETRDQEADRRIYNNIEEIVSKFPEGKDRYLKSALFNCIVQTLARGESPYDVIDQLIRIAEDSTKALEHRILHDLKNK